LLLLPASSLTGATVAGSWWLGYWADRSDTIGADVGLETCVRRWRPTRLVVGAVPFRSGRRRRLVEASPSSFRFVLVVVVDASASFRFVRSHRRLVEASLSYTGASAVLPGG
jgi:hypothetical protein